jgi:hypothetical protein
MQEQAKGPSSLRDFQSQLTMIERIDYQSMKKLAGNGPRLPDQARREQVYLANLINESFNDVRLIDTDLLSVFHNLDPWEAPARRIND